MLTTNPSAHTISGLIAKRAEIAGQIEHTQDKLRQLVIDLDHVDAAIHIFDPSIGSRCTGRRARKKSVDFNGYWQRHVKQGE